jgi:lysyl-tRNA synthetase class 2
LPASPHGYSSAAEREHVASPSDLGRELREPLRVGGRVTHVGHDAIALSDAWTTLRVKVPARPEALEPGDLVVVQLATTSAPLLGSIVEHYRASYVGAGEFARLAGQGIGGGLARRASALRDVRRYFDTEGFLEVDTPVRVPTPGLDLHVDAVASDGGWLVTSPEFQMKRLLVGGLPRIYQLVHCTRANEHGQLHEPEFLMLEWYRAFADQEAVMRDTECIVEAVVRDSSVILPNGRKIDVTSPFERVSVRDAFAQHAGVRDAVDLAHSDEAAFFQLFVDVVEPALAAVDRALFLCEYPASQASLARRSLADPTVAERFELYIAGVELCNGFSELTDPREQQQRFEADRALRARLGRPVYEIDARFMAALREGMPPSAGNALGVDRLVMLATGARNIADVQGFPAAWL